MEIIVIAAVMVIVWMMWQLYRAKRFNKFKQTIINDIKPLVIQHIEEDLIAHRSQQTPNTDAHIHASQYYWTQFPSRTLQMALQWQLIDKEWLKRTGNVRNCQHLFYIERDKLIEFDESKESE